MVHQIIKGSMIGMVLFSSCYYDVEEKLYPMTECVTTNMSYQNNIEPILERNCYVCHSAATNTGNITLEGHAQLLVYVNSGQLLGAIRHESGYMMMPQNASKLRDCDISKIEQWIADGAQNN